MNGITSTDMSIPFQISAPSSLNTPGNSTHKTLDIGIVGAGIAGLGAAIALRREGHRVEIFERSKFKYEVGAAIHICPNATRILRSWGFDFARAQAVIAERRNLMRADTLEIMYTADCKHTVADFGAEWYLFHRVDLHTELLRLAEQPEGEGIGKPVKIRLDAEVSRETDIETATIRLEHGEEFKKDLIVAADGVHSRFVAKVLNGYANTATPSGHYAFRFLIPTDTLLADPLTRPFFSQGNGNMNIATHPDRRLVFYPCRANNIQNFVALHPRVHSPGMEEDWQAAGTSSRDDLLAAFPDAHLGLQAAMQKANDIKLWPLLFRKPLQTWHKGRCILIGDAAHPMLPHQGQAGAQALEDGVALAIMLSQLHNPHDIPGRLELFEQVRINRASAMQIFSNVGQDEAEKIKSAVQAYVKGPIPQTPGEFMEWNFRHDVMKESLALRREKLGF